MKNINFKRFFVAGLSISFALTPLFASAQTATELQAQIAALLAQIKTLQSQLSQTEGGSSATFCHNFETNFGVGNSGSETSTLLTALVKEGVASERSSNFSQTFDEEMASNISAFQEKYRTEILSPAGLRAGTGYLGARTRAKLNQLYGCSKPVVTIPTPVSTPVNVPADPTSEPKPVNNPTPISTGPTIYGVSGPQTLKVNEQGTWTVKAGSPSGSNLSYSVTWGDEIYIANVTAYSQRVPTVGQSATFTHVYSQAGNYTPTFTVTSENTIVCITTPCPSNGGKAQTSLSVNVLGGAVSNSQPVLNAIAVPVNIAVGQSVNFNFSATDADNDDLSWSVSWGESGGSSSACQVNPPKGTGKNWDYSSSHSWTNSGSYTVILYVNDCKGGIAKTAFTVNVGGVTATPTISVLSPNGGENWQIGQSKKIAWSTQNVPTGAQLYLSLAEGPTPIEIYLKPISSSNSFDFTLPKSGCITDYCYDLKPGNYKISAVLYDRVPCLALCPPGSLSNEARVIARDFSDASFTISDGGGATTTQTLSIVTPSPLNNAIVAQNYNLSIAGTGGVDSYTWSVGGELPPGLVLSNAVCALSPCKGYATIYGTPTTRGSYTFYLTLTSGSQKVSKVFSMDVLQSVALPLSSAPMSQSQMASVLESAKAALEKISASLR